MNEWCKIIEVDGKTVLFYAEPDTENDADKTKLHQIYRTEDGIFADVAVTNIDEEIEIVVAACDEEKARGIIAAVERLLG